MSSATCVANSTRGLPATSSTRLLTRGVAEAERERVAAAEAAVRGWSGCRASAAARLVCSQWQAVHDELVRRLVLRANTTDEAMGMLVRRFPAVVSLEMKRKQSDYINRALLTNEGMRAVIK